MSSKGPKQHGHGDRKGNQSGKGLAAKKEANICALTLPPWTPSWMPLDFYIWAAIEAKMIQTDPGCKETKEEYLSRLRAAAKSLPRGSVANVIQRMKANIQEDIDAKGYHAKNG